MAFIEVSLSWTDIELALKKSYKLKIKQNFPPKFSKQLYPFTVSINKDHLALFDLHMAKNFVAEQKINLFMFGKLQYRQTKYTEHKILMGLDFFFSSEAHACLFKLFCC